MKKRFTTTTLKQSIVALILIAAGLLLSGKANATCTANFYYTVNKLAVTFSDSGSTAWGDAHTTAWDFGDSSTATTDDPHHTYSKAGTYHVCVTIYDTKTSCSASFCRDIAVSNCSLVSAFSYTVTGARTIKFTSTGSSSKTMKYVWNFADSTMDSTSGDTVSHTYGGIRNSYLVYLSIYDPATGCSASSSVWIAICKASSHILMGNVGKTVTFNGDSTNNPKDTYAWTLGDGSTRTDMDFSYTYSGWGTYNVCLSVTDPTQSCTTQTCTSITLTDPLYCLSGNVSAGTDQVAPCKIYLISFNPTDSSLTAIDSTGIIIDSLYSYSFCHIPNGTYYTKAALMPTSPGYKDYVPTYHNDALRWKTAVAITINGGSVSNENIAMKAGTNPGGPGFIGGKISAGANKVGDPVSGIQVVLYSASGNPVGYTYSDVNGLYSFTNLAYGTYSIEADIPGKVDYPVSVTISADYPAPDKVNLAVNSKTITGSDMSGIKEAFSAENAVVYPNPVNDKLMISTDLKNAQKGNIEILDVTGKVVATFEKNINAGKQTLELDAKPLRNGIYFVKIQLQKDNKTLEARFVKAQ